jgi:hypothetical protein
MPTSADLILHHLCIKGLADAPALARCTGLPEHDVDAALARLQDLGHVLVRTGRLAGFAPTPAGREAHAAGLAGDALRARRDELAPWYERFEVVNAELKALCTAWQLIDGERPNDHTDTAYDAGVLEQLAGLHARAAALLAETGDLRLAQYARRLDEAATAVAAGDVRRFTSPLCDSYHDVWMELHHDLLTSFDRARTATDA